MAVTTISGRRFALDAERVAGALQEIAPEPIRDHYVVVRGRRYPPKQAIAVATGLDRADFTTHQARAILLRLGFVAGRSSGQPGDRNEPVSNAAVPSGPGGGEAEILRPFIGRWVAQRGLEVLVDAETPAEIVQWLAKHRQRADMMFRVPESEAQAGGGAP